MDLVPLNLSSTQSSTPKSLVLFLVPVKKQDLKNRVKQKSFQNFIWKNKISPLLKTQEKDFHKSYSND